MTVNDYRDLDEYEQLRWLGEYLTDHFGTEVIAVDIIPNHGLDRSFSYVIPEAGENELEQYAKELRMMGLDAINFVDESDGQEYLEIFPLRGLPEEIFESNKPKKMNKLNEKNWQATIDVTPAMKAWEDNEDAGEFKQLLINIIEENLDKLANVIDSDALYELETRIIEELKMIDDDPNEIDYVLEELYNWANDYNIWIETLMPY